MSFPDPTWIVPFRSDALTSFFMLFPYLVMPSFYLSAIALGHWLYPKNRLFAAWGFLIPFAALLNGILKHAFQIPRPPISLHLIPVTSFGFPSGDTQVAAVFWLSLFWALRRHTRWAYLCWLPLLGVACSRVYLGVHSVWDVSVGLLVAISVLWVWYHPTTDAFKDRILRGQRPLYWGVLGGSTALFLFLAGVSNWGALQSAVLGSLIGYGLVLSSIQNSLEGPKDTPSLKRIIFALAGVSILVCFIDRGHAPASFLWLWYLSIMLRFALIYCALFAWIPWIKKRVCS